MLPNGIEVGVGECGAGRDSLSWVIAEEAGEQVKGLRGYLGMNLYKTQPDQGGNRNDLEDLVLIRFQDKFDRTGRVQAPRSYVARTVHKSIFRASQLSVLSERSYAIV